MVNHGEERLDIRSPVHSWILAAQYLQFCQLYYWSYALTYTPPALKGHI
jgi:hypothetical protein